MSRHDARTRTNVLQMKQPCRANNNYGPLSRDPQNIFVSPVSIALDDRATIVARPSCCALHGNDSAMVR